MKLELLSNPKNVKDASVIKEIPGLMICPIDKIGDEDYWTFRVNLNHGQALVAIPKFGTLGIGFLKEIDWNRNLPYGCGVEKIWKHIASNKGEGNSITDCKKALNMLCDACSAYMGK